MIDLKFNINTYEEAEQYINECEKTFSDNLDAAIETLFDSPVGTITLSGPTCSGKTTTANKLTRRIRKSGKNAVRISIDDFFISRSDRNFVDGDSPDYDSVAAIDLDCLAGFTKRLYLGLPALMPCYDFNETGRVGYTELYPDADDIYIFEGIQGVYPEVTSLLEEHKGIFLTTPDGIRYNGSSLDRHEMRLLRRLVRDAKFRGATAEFTLHLWVGVRDNEEKNIFPNAADCTVNISSYLFYEPFILARHAIPLLDTVPKDSRYRAQADDLMERLTAFDFPLFREEMVPEFSMFREFIGRKS